MENKNLIQVYTSPVQNLTLASGNIADAESLSLPDVLSGNTIYGFKLFFYPFYALGAPTGAVDPGIKYLFGSLVDGAANYPLGDFVQTPEIITYEGIVLRSANPSLTVYIGAFEQLGSNLTINTRLQVYYRQGAGGDLVPQSLQTTLYRAG